MKALQGIPVTADDELLENADQQQSLVVDGSTMAVQLDPNDPNSGLIQVDAVIDPLSPNDDTIGQYSENAQGMVITGSTGFVDTDLPSVNVKYAGPAWQNSGWEGEGVLPRTYSFTYPNINYSEGISSIGEFIAYSGA